MTRSLCMNLITLFVFSNVLLVQFYFYSFEFLPKHELTCHILFPDHMLVIHGVREYTISPWSYPGWNLANVRVLMVSKITKRFLSLIPAKSICCRRGLSCDTV
jgi:hypothetical protein